MSPRGGKRPGAGRPSTGATKRLNIRVSPGRLAAYHEAAARAGVKLSDWVIAVLDVKAGCD